MKALKKIFPVAFAFSKNGGMLTLGIILHLLAAIVVPIVVVVSCGVCSAIVGGVGLITVLFSVIPILGYILTAISNIIGIFINVFVWGVGITLIVVFALYCLTSLVMNILAFAKVFEKPSAKVDAQETVENTAEAYEMANTAEAPAEEVIAEKAVEEEISSNSEE